MLENKNGAITVDSSLGSVAVSENLWQTAGNEDGLLSVTDKIVSLPAVRSYGHWTAWTPLETFMYMDTNLFMFYSVWILAVFFLVIYIVSMNQHFMALLCSVTRLYRLAKMPPDIVEWPSVSIVKPVLGVDDQLLDNLESFFKMDYGGKFELLFCVEDPQDTALTVVHSLVAKYPSVEVRIFDKGTMGSTLMSSGKPGDAPTIINPMVRNMVQGYENAKYEYVWISSARCRCDGDMLRDMVARASDPTVGLVHQMPYIWVPPYANDCQSHVNNGRSCPSGSSSLGSLMERLCFSTSLARPYLALAFMNITCFTGMSYVFRREVMEEAGGLRSFGHYLAEDFHISATIGKLGYRHVLAAVPALQNNGSDMSLNTLKDRLVRWHRLRLSLMAFITICLEPFQECLIVGAAASWALHFIFSLDPVYFFPGHIVVWFCFDALLFCAGHRNLSSHGAACCCCCASARMNPLVYIITWMGLQMLPFYIIFESFCNPRHIRWVTAGQQMIEKAEVTDAIF